ncbi:cell growth regulator with RING finger domain protein 1 [Danio rerio]|uniref:Cell growth regulator with RING finger domain protein 1 n=3 Tax=Danio rerio TaxID=7955 RepID=Q1JQ68_DANRE|nr:cell growth regulator with RING finger domain protein 1 [Danio rerio]AAI16466.1 Si:dkey-63j12.2 [Danio rerio]|eukprot:NP_001038722.1 cell growth regulator with RING finger domain protein 1 [Danio rerio]
MAAEFLVMLYEYSPLFYIAVISLCFIITVAVVLGWFGFDVPVILRSSDESESVIPVPERKMVQVINPFALEVNSTSASVTEGVSLLPCCLEDCVLSCFWGCGVQALQTALQSHQLELRFHTAELFQEALGSCCRHHQTFNVQKEEREEYFTQMPPALEVTDFGLLPRDRYPLVAVLTLAHPETRDNYNIASSVTVIHVPDDKYRLSTRILFQYLLTAHGTLYDLKPLFMSADNSNLSGSSEPSRTQGAELQPESSGEKGEESDSEGEWPDIQGRDCVVCQNASINRVLLPCRHACVCDGCVCRFQHCPICRAFVFESFALANRPAHNDDEDEEDFTD